MTRERAVEILKALLPTAGSAGIFVESEYEALSFAIQELEKRGEDKQELCETCQGEGKIPIGEHLVTREMAHDAGDPALEGTLYEIEYAKCERCGGDGFIILPATPPKEETPK